MDKTKCVECSKIVRFYGIKCKCVDANNDNLIFCSTCICIKSFPNDVGHACTFDYKQNGRKQSSLNNPLIIPTKVDKL